MKSGILLHISSLPSGTLGTDAFTFVDFLAETNQSYWQILPLNPPDPYDSPYQSFSAFAGNENFVEPGKETVGFDKFCVDGNFFDYALFMTLKDVYKTAWNLWPEKYKNRNKKALAVFAEEHRNKIRHRQFRQFLFFKQWAELKKYANNQGVEIIGDIPIYVAYDSVDVWCTPEMFELDKKGKMKCVAGVPPDYFSESGQLWGNPIYNWKHIKDTGYKWWTERFKNAMELFDIVRVDHFRGFSAYYTVPCGNTDARKGKWEDGPGIELFNTIKKTVPDCRIIAEDLGVSDKALIELVADSGFPSMAVVQFGLDGNLKNKHLPVNYKSNMAVYSGTHDNDTLTGFLSSLNKKDKEAMLVSVKHCCKKTGLPYNPEMSDGKIADLIISLLMKSGADTVIIPIQDWLQQNSESRMNTPSTVSGKNWTYRINQSNLKSETLKVKIKKITSLRNS